MCYGGYLTQEDGSAYYICSECGKKLSCPRCGADHSLKVQTEGTKIAHCSTCSTTWYWDENKRPKPKKKKKSKILMGKAQRECPKCTSQNIILVKEGSMRCLSCGVEFPEHLASVALAKDKQLITDPKEVRRLAKALLDKCHVCGWPKVEQTFHGLRCEACGAILATGDIPDVAIDPSWDICCPSCSTHGEVIKHSTGQLECFKCGSRWGSRSGWAPIVRKTEEEKAKLPIVAGSEAPSKCSHCKDGGNIKLDPNDGCYFCVKCHTIVGINDQFFNAQTERKNKTVCTVCNDGFFHNGQCNRCGARVRICNDCGQSYLGLSTQSVCEDCRDEKLEIECPTCGESELIHEADLYCQCSTCEHWYAVKLPAALAPQARPEPIDSRKFRRYEDRAGSLDGLIDQAIEHVRDAQEANDRGVLVDDHFQRIEDVLQRFVDVQSYIDSGFDGNVVEGDDLWLEDDVEDRWSLFDREQRLASRQDRILNAYNEVQIEDAGDELDDEEEVDVHDYESRCPCGGEIDDYGMCHECGRLHEMMPDHMHR